MLSNDVMNAEDVARLLDLGKNTVYQLAKEGKLASYRVGRKLRFTMEDVEAYIASTRQTGIGSTRSDDTRSFPPVASPSPAASQALSQAASFGALQVEPFVLAGEDMVADVIVGNLNSLGIPAVRLVRGSYTALVNLYAGDAHMAVVNLYDQRSNSSNLPYVRNLAPGANVVVFRLYARSAGFAVAKGNPKRIASWGALLREGVRLSNRSKGSGARVLLDEKLCAMEAKGSSIQGYDSDELVAPAAIKRVAMGSADACVCCGREAEQFKAIDFVPLQTEWVDLVVVKTQATRPLIRALKALLVDKRFEEAVASFSPSDLGHLGSIIYES